MVNDLQIVPASTNNVEAQYVEMMVPLYSYGCEKKVQKALSHLKGIYSVNVDYNKQKVTVWGICNKDDVLSTIKNKRKAARFWIPDDDHNLIHRHQYNNHDQSHDHDHDHNHDHDDESPTVLSRQSLPPKHYYHSMISFSKRSSLALSYKVRSLNWKAMKKAFIRSYSF